MKIFTSKDIREADAYTIENEPISSVDLMERAAGVFYECFVSLIEKQDKIAVFAGVGNNGGDGLVVARMLHQNFYNVRVYIVNFSEKRSPDFLTNFERLSSLSPELISEINEGDDLPSLNDFDIIIDGIFGSGLSRPVEGLAGEIIRHINKTNKVKVAIDIPSGLFCEDNSENNPKNIIRADYTITFELPKLAFLFAENSDFVGEWMALPIGLHKGFINEKESKYQLVDIEMIRTILIIRKKFSHKGSYGHALIISGSYGKVGAAVLASKACLRSGAGLVTVHIPKCGYNVLQTAVPEAMTVLNESEELISGNIKTEMFNAVGIGPGIGKDKKTETTLKLIIQNAYSPVVFDADAINIIAENKTWIPFIHRDSIFTPHPKEFERLVGKTSNNFKRIGLQREFSMKYGVYVVLKGAYSSISCPDGTIYFNSTGNAGMATGGSGDVLTGIITGLLAQGYSSRNACILGVYLHGLSGDIAARKKSQEAMIAGDIIEYLGKAYKTIRI
ncbi:MAG: NAD(P)H-hydrate dehydratase [Bacteroidota bacterium]|nr:NAD(P)H-hydrate dehydratase [Bacteroidota bacterium]